MAGSDRSTHFTIPAWLRALDLLLAITILPLLGAALYAQAGVRRVYYPPRRRKRQQPEDVGLSAERISVTGADGVVLDTWVMPAAGATGTIVISHSVGRSKASVLPHALMLHQAGYNVVAFDMRGHGDSTSARVSGGFAERYLADFRAVLSEVRKRLHPDGGGIALLCFSFSTWPALEMARVRDLGVRAVICDSGPTANMLGSFSRMFALRRAALPVVFRGPILYRVVLAVFSRNAQRLLAPGDWPPDLSSSAVRLLFIAGAADPVIPPDEVRDIADRYPGAELWVVPGATHAQSLETSPDDYRARVTAFLAAAFAAGAGGAGTAEEAGLDVVPPGRERRGAR